MSSLCPQRHDILERAMTIHDFIRSGPDIKSYRYSAGDFEISYMGASIKDVHSFLAIFDPPPPLSTKDTFDEPPLKKTYTFD